MNDMLKGVSHVMQDAVKLAVEHGLGWFLASAASLAALLSSFNLG